MELKYVNDVRTAHPERPGRTYPYRHCVVALAESLRKWLKHLALPTGTKVVDYGCSVMQYRNFFPADCDYRGADLPGNSLATIEVNADGCLNLPDASVDVVLSTQVLEHVQDPQLYVSEAFRVLKPGGHFILTTHGVFVYHPDPEDNWRWTSNGLRREVERSGLEIVDMEGLIGGAAAAVQFIQDSTWHRIPARLRRFYFAFFQMWVGFLDRKYTPEGRMKDAWVYSVLARKPVEKS